ncbi:hypothetical protein ACFU3E_20230 [Streptomyces sp. NPDC057424]
MTSQDGGSLWAVFADHFVSPFPPPGSTLDAEPAAGERTLK